ncbi:MAG TPA: LacI family DNA-binding transcriptional regulator [Thermomicrobiales bacterium]
MATIKEVAARAGVSPGTVSHTLNGTRRVDPETRARVLAAARELGYRPNGLARGLRRRESRAIGLLVPDNSNPVFADIARGIEDAVYEEGYNVILCNSDQSEEKEDRYLDALLSKRVDGLILASGSSRPDVIRRVIEAGVPLVVIPGVLTDFPADHVLGDDVTGGRIAAKYLLDLGHRRIGYIAGPRVGTVSSGRAEGFREVLAEAGVALPEDAIVGGDFRVGGGEAAMAELLRRDLGLTAVFAANDLMAIGAIKLLRRAGIRVPEDISIIGLDGIWIGEVISPALTTVAQPIAEAARVSTRLLFERMRQPDLPPRRILLSPTLIERESCAPPAGA